MKKLIKKAFNYQDVISFGNMFLLANGKYGYRGTLEEFKKEEMVGLNMLGVYDRYKDKWRESINLPNPFYILVKGNKEYSLLKERPLTHEISLDIENGVFTRQTTFDDVSICSTRFVSHKNKSVLATKYVVIDICLDVILGLDLDIYEINGPHFKEKKCQRDGSVVSFEGTTNEGKALHATTNYSVNRGLLNKYSGDSIYGYQLKVALKKDEELVIEIISQVQENDLLNEKFDDLLLQHKNSFKALWNNAFVEIKGDEDVQFELAYSIYHLLILEDDNSLASVPARGLSGQTYKGAIFWDTEMFMLPFYILTNPKFARNLIHLKF